MPQNVKEVPVLLCATGEEARRILLADWRERSECRRRKLPWSAFYDSKSTARVDAACAKCTVRPECLEYALITREKGQWAGTSERFRVKIRRQWIAQHERAGTFPPCGHKAYGRKLSKAAGKILAHLHHNHDEISRGKKQKTGLTTQIASKLRLGQRRVLAELRWMEKAHLVSLEVIPKRGYQVIALTASGKDLIIADVNILRK